MLSDYNMPVTGLVSRNTELREIVFYLVLSVISTVAILSPTPEIGHGTSWALNKYMLNEWVVPALQNKVL